MPAFSISVRGDPVGQQARHGLRQLAERRAVRLHADRVDDGVGAAAVGHLAHRSGDVVVARGGRACSTPWRRASASRSGTRSTPITRPAPRCSAIRHAHLRRSARGRRRRRVPPSGIAGVLDRLPGRRQHVGEVDEALVGRALRHLDRAELRLRDAQQLRLAAGHLRRRASCSRTAPRPCPASRTCVVSHCECRPWSHMKQWPQEMLNGITTRSPGCDVLDLGADLLDDAHRLVAEDVALVEERRRAPRTDAGRSRRCRSR